jgi:hypothetical protein
MTTRYQRLLLLLTVAALRLATGIVRAVRLVALYRMSHPSESTRQKARVAAPAGIA